MVAAVHKLNTSHTIAPQLWSNEAEQAVLGALLQDNSGLEKTQPLIKPESFYAHAHQVIYRAILASSANGQAFDVITLAEWLERQRGKKDSGSVLDSIGGLAYLGELVKAAPTTSNVGAYAEIVRLFAIKRAFLAVSERAKSEILENQYGDISLSLASITRDLSALQDDLLPAGGKSDFADMRAMLSSAIDLVDKRFNADSLITGVPTGWNRFDEITSGMQPGDLIIVAGRPSMGKSAFAGNIAISVSSLDSPALFFSLEMPAEQIVLRAMSAESRVDFSRLRNGQLEDDDWPKITSAVSMLGDRHLFVNDKPGLSVDDIIAYSRSMSKEHGQLGCIVVDYIQLMRASTKHDRRDLEVADITRGLKLLAKELNTPVIALSQLNRGLEQRRDRRPMMSDLRESGAIEQDADVIIFIYRDEVYNPDSVDKGLAEIIIAKQRNGEIGTIPFVFIGKNQRFEEYAGNAMPSAGGNPGYSDHDYHDNSF